MKPLSGNKYLVMGSMSGTSLDGLDLAVVEFTRYFSKWQFEIVACGTTDYPEQWLKQLSIAHTLSGSELLILHNRYGKYLGEQINHFLQVHQLKPILIASHGHTIFHQPEKSFTFQLGNGASIVAETNIPVAADFRTGDVALGGQGAPLVPAGDRLLFPDYEACLNLGGFANISFEQTGNRIAYDICPVNFVLNDLAQQLGLPFDEDGKTGRSGNVYSELLEHLNQLPYYRQTAPKSLGREWVDTFFKPLISNYSITVPDILRTCYEHIAIQIAGSLPVNGKVLITGGGAFNSFLISRLKKYTHCSLVIPQSDLVNYKEAVIFAFLGLLRLLEETNCYASVTGASRDSSTGVVFL